MLLAAEFLAVIQVLVYAGGIVVLYLFVVMLVNLKRPPESTFDPARRSRLGLRGRRRRARGARRDPRLWAAAAVAGCLGPRRALPQEQRRDRRLLLYTDYLIPFEVASMLLLVAMIGAIILAKRESD